MDENVNLTFHRAHVLRFYVKSVRNFLSGEKTFALHQERSL